MAPRSVAEKSFKAPPKVPKPVRAPDRNTISRSEDWDLEGMVGNITLADLQGNVRLVYLYQPTPKDSR